MKTSRTTVAVTAAVASAVLLLSGCGGSTTAGGAVTATGTTAPTSSSMMSGQGSQGDILFAQSMIPHHQQAVEMADLALEKASSGEVLDLATAIKAAQDPEITTMRGWLQKWDAPEAMGGMEGHDMGSMTDGMMTDQQMSDLEAASGADFDAMWLTMMIQHHQGAVTMAQDALGQTQDPEVKTLAQNVIEAQNTEIATMEGLLTR